jgi:tetratricopeptide (TPR) repeat protein
MADEKIHLLPEIEQLTEKLVADPKSRVFAQLADAYRKCGMFDEAIDTAKKGLEIHPKYAVAHLILGRCYMAKKMYALAREEFELTIRNDPQNIVGYRLLAETHERQNMYSEAVKYYQMVLDLDPTNVDIAEKVENLKGALKTPAPSRPEPEPEPDGSAGIKPEVQPQPMPATEVEAAGPTVQEPEAPPSAASAPLEIEPITEAFPGVGETFKIPETAEPAQPVPAAGDEKKGLETSVAEEAAGGVTATLAELYASQGHYEKAVEAYRQLIAAEPENQAYKGRMDELLAKAFPELTPGPELELAAASEISAPPAPEPAVEAQEVKTEEAQAVELTGMFAEMEKLAAVAEPAPAGPAPEPLQLEKVFPIEETKKSVEEEPAAAALSALFAEEPPAPPAPQAEAEPQKTSVVESEPSAPEAEEPKENAVSSFQAWLNSIQK